MYYNAAKDEYFIGLNDRYDYKYIGLSESERLVLYPEKTDDGTPYTGITGRYKNHDLSFYSLKLANSVLAYGGNAQIAPLSLDEVGYSNPAEGDKIFRFKTSFQSKKKYTKEVKGTRVIKMDMSDFEKFEYHEKKYVHKAHPALKEGFYEETPPAGTSARYIAPSDIQAGDIISDGLKKYVKLDAIAHQDAITFKAKG